MNKEEYKYWDMELKDISKAVKKDLKKEYPHMKCSVRTYNYNSVEVSIKEIPRAYLKSREEYIHYLDTRYNLYDDSGICQRNLLLSDYDNNKVMPSFIKDEIWDNIQTIHQKYNYDNSDLMTDYFDMRYYGTVHIDDECVILEE